MDSDVEHYQRILREQLPRLAEQYGVASLALFGSRVRGEARSDSDLGVLVTFREMPSLLRLIELEDYLSDLVGVKVDLALPGDLKPRIRSRILAETTPV